MAVMNRFAPVTVSWKQTQPKVISECCFLTEGILFQQTSLLNTSFFPQPPTEQHQDLLCLFILPPPHPSTPSLLSALLKLPLSFGSIRSAFNVLCHKFTLCPESPHCRGHDVSSHFLSQMANGCSISGTEKHPQLLSMITFPLLGHQQNSPQTGDRRTNHFMHLTAALQGCLLFSTMVAEHVKKGL